MELPGAVALTSGRVFRGLLVQNVCVQTVQDLLIGAASGSGLVFLLRAPTRVGLVSGQGVHPLSAAVAAVKELIPFQTMLLCEAWAGFGVIRDTSPRS